MITAKTILVQSSVSLSPANALAALLGGLLAVSLVGCAADKSSNPLSPTVAGPIPGVNISAPNVLSPQATRIEVDNQPVTLMVENAASSGVRPLVYVFEVAADVSFTNIVFRREDVTPGDGGRTSLRLPDRLAPERTYYWRSRAQDGANTGPFSPPAHFDVVTPVVLGPPGPVAPINNVLVDSLRPTFTFVNAPRTGPAGAITYILEISDSDTFVVKATGTVAEQPTQTSYPAPQDGNYNKQYFWHVRAQEATTVGPWSATQVFRTPAPPPPPPSGGGGGGGGNPSVHVPAGPLTEDRARDVVMATAKEFPGLTAVFDSDEGAVNAARELLLRTIWHLHLAGYDAGRQKNPSGAISDDKMTIFVNGAWHAYDIFSLGFRGRATTVQFLEVGSPNPLAEGGIPD